MIGKSTQNAANLPLQTCVQTCDKNQWTFFVVRHGLRLELPQ